LNPRILGKHRCPFRLLATLASLVLVSAVPALVAQSFDATSINQTATIDSGWLIHAGDAPTYAQPGFDDSQWTLFDTKAGLRSNFPADSPSVVWYRLHVKVAPTQTGLALQVNSFSRAFEVYVNGSRLMDSGQVAPFVPYSSQATLIAPISDDQISTGSIVIALRVHLTPSEWADTSPGISASSLTLGQEALLRQGFWLSMLGGYAVDWTWAVIVFAVSLLALMLYTAQRERIEYLWAFLLGIAEVAAVLTGFVFSVHNFPLAGLIPIDLLEISTNFLLIFVYFGFVRERISRRVWIYLAAANLLVALDQIFYLLGRHSSSAILQPIVADIVSELIPLFFIPAVLIESIRRGNREARILLVALGLSTLYDYPRYAAILLQQIPAAKASASAFQSRLDNLHAGPLALPIGDLGGILCWLSLAAIMVLRSNRATRQQVILEGQVAAAREVQQVILPEHTESVPGFTIESVYQPAQQVGGDFFQILPAEGGGMILVVGDVAGKGLPAAMLVSVLVGAIRGVAEYTEDPAELLSSLNERLVGRGSGGFSTALVARITANGAVTIANAGHLSPYLDGSEVELPGALPLGVMSGVTYETSQFNLAHGSRLTFYSDGVVEAQNQHGELFGFDRAKELSTQPAASIVEAAKQFGQEDDITVVTIEREAAIASAA
jgi:stage II sporulation SpoE-like protein